MENKKKGGITNRVVANSAWIIGERLGAAAI